MYISICMAPRNESGTKDGLTVGIYRARIPKISHLIFATLERQLGKKQGRRGTDVASIYKIYNKKCHYKYTYQRNVLAEAASSQAHSFIDLLIPMAWVSLQANWQSTIDATGTEQPRRWRLERKWGRAVRLPAEAESFPHSTHPWGKGRGGGRSTLVNFRCSWAAEPSSTPPATLILEVYEDVEMRKRRRKVLEANLSIWHQ